MTAPNTGHHTMSNDNTPSEAGSTADPLADGKKTKARTEDTNNPRTRSPADQVKVWEEEGGSPPEQISSTSSVKPKAGSKAGSMGPAKD